MLLAANAWRHSPSDYVNSTVEATGDTEGHRCCWQRSEAVICPQPQTGTCTAFQKQTFFPGVCLRIARSI